jgi:hypothetical protein
MAEIKLVSYDGEYPNLCSGTLVLSFDGQERSFEYCLSSGGSVSFDNDWNATVTSGSWTFHDDSLSDKENIYITHLVNENIYHGCCGGCI